MARLLRASSPRIRRERFSLFPRAVVWSFATFVVARVLLSLMAVVVVSHVPPGGWEGAPLSTSYATAATPGWHNLIDGTFRWDAAWFVEIADIGYRIDRLSAAYLPGFPLAARAMNAATPFGLVTAATLASNIALTGALIALYLLTTIERDEAIARRTIVLLMAFPASVALLAPYSESQFLLGTVLAFFGTRTQRWWLAGAGGLLATVTRTSGLAVVPALLIEAFAVDRKERPKALIAASAPLLGPIVYQGYWASRGDAFAPARAQAAWLREITSPLETAWRGIAAAATGMGRGRPDLVADLLLTALVVVPLVLGWRSLRRSYQSYVALSLVVPLVYAAERPLLSMPRFALVLFPAFWILGSLLRGWMFVAVASAFGVVSLAFAAEFMNWVFVF